MLNRATLLRWMLYCLALAAGAGVLAVLTSSYDVMGRVGGTGVCLAVALGVSWRLLPMLDRDDTRAAGTLGLVAVVIEFILVAALIWVDWVLHSQLLEAMRSLALIVLPMTPAAMACLVLMNRVNGKIAGRVGLGITILATLPMIVAALVPFTRHASSPYWETGWALIGLGTPIVIALIGAGTNDRRWWRWGGVIAAVIAVAMAMASIWGGVEGGSGTFAGMVCLAVVIAHGNVAALAPLRPGQGWVRYVALGAAACTGVGITLLVGLESNMAYSPTYDLVGRTTSAAAIVTACASLGLLIFAGMNRRIEPAERSGRTYDRLTIICPGCQRKQELSTGDSRCEGCGLKFAIRIEEPACQRCGYLLYNARQRPLPRMRRGRRGGSRRGGESWGLNEANRRRLALVGQPSRLSLGQA